MKILPICILGTNAVALSNQLHFISFPFFSRCIFYKQQRYQENNFSKELTTVILVTCYQLSLAEIVSSSPFL